MNIIKYIAGFFFATTLVLICLYRYADLKADKLEGEKKALKIENEKYINQLEKEHNDKVELNRKYKELEAKAKSDKNFDWFADISNSPVINELRN